MECPKCGQNIQGEKVPDGSLAFFCKACGWGRDHALARKAGMSLEDPPGRIVPLSIWIKLALSWTASLVITLGPFLVIVFGLPALIDRIGLSNHSDATPAKLSADLTPIYWIILVVYLGLANILSPKFDPDNLGLFGGPWIDNPFTFEDDYNRVLMFFAIVLAPGKFVWFTIHRTIRVMKKLAVGR